jgi:hypothetical protein
MDVIAYCNDIMGLGLIHEKGSYYKGGCPICRQKETFAISKKTGACRCRNCGNISDFLYVLERWLASSLEPSKNHNLNRTLEFLSDYLEKAENDAFGFASTGGAV